MTKAGAAGSDVGLSLFTIELDMYLYGQAGGCRCIILTLSYIAKVDRQYLTQDSTRQAGSRRRHTTQFQLISSCGTM